MPARNAAPSLPARRAWVAAAFAGLAGAVLAVGVRHRWPAAAGTPAALPEGDVCLVAPPSPYDPASGLAPTTARPVPADARCPVCGMFPARAPQWAAQLIFEDGDAHFFDSPLSLFQYLQDLPRYSPGRSAAQVAAAYVTDAGDPPGGWLPAHGAWYVHGSDARGPMRAGNLPAFATREAAQGFAARRGGEVLAHGQVSPALVATLAGRGGHRH